MLGEQNIISSEELNILATAIQSLNTEAISDAKYDGSVEDLFFFIQREISNACDDKNAAGKLHTARSRNDIDVTIYRLVDYVKARKEATDYVRLINDDNNFNDINYIFPVFILQNMPIGVIGMIMAAIMAAAMSSVSSELNSLATTSTMDIYRQHINPKGNDEDLLRFGKIATFLWGIFACFVAMYVTNLGSLIEVVNKFGSFFYGSLLGVFVLAFSAPKANANGAFYGLIVGMISVWIISSYSEIAFLWFNVIGCFITIGVGLIISITVKKNDE